MKLHLYKEKQEILAQQDFSKIENTINQITLFTTYHDLPPKHIDYHIGSLSCMNKVILVDIIDESGIDQGIWIQICTYKQILCRIPASVRHISSPVYVNTLISLFDDYCHSQPLKKQLQLRPFGIDYEYHPT